MDSTGFCLPSNWSLEEWPDVIAVTHEGTCEGIRVYVPERTCEGCVLPSRDYGHAPSPCSFCARNSEERYDLYTPAKVVE